MRHLKEELDGLVQNDQNYESILHEAQMQNYCLTEN